MKAQLLTLLSIAVITGSCTKEVQPRPAANFKYSVSQVSPTQVYVSFVNTSTNADRYQWSTSGGIATSTTDFDVTYTENGRYRVSLTAKNDAGEDTKTESIDIASIATTGSVVFWTQYLGNYGDISIYVNNSYQGKLTKYRTVASRPDCGQEGFVTMTLNPGTYSFTAQSQGLFPLKWSSNFTVDRGVCKGWELSK